MPYFSAMLIRRSAFGVSLSATICRLPLTAPAPPPTSSVGKQIRRVHVPVPHAAAVEQKRVIEQRSVAILGRLQSLDELREEREVIRVHFRVHFDRRRPVAVVRDRMVRLGDADVEIRPLTELASQHECEHTRQVGLIRDEQQVEQELDVFFEGLGHTHRGIRYVGNRARPAARRAECAARSRERDRGTGSGAHGRVNRCRPAHPSDRPPRNRGDCGRSASSRAVHPDSHRRQTAARTPSAD